MDRSSERSRQPRVRTRVGRVPRFVGNHPPVAGYDAAVAAREKQIDDLRKLLTKTMWELRAPNPDTEAIANRISRALSFRWQ